MPEFRHDYLLDGDVLAHIQHRPDSNYIFEGIVEGVKAGKVKTVRQISSGELKKWNEAYAAMHPHNADFEIEHALQYADEVSLLIEKVNDLVPDLYERFGGKNPDPADPWLIAVAKVYGFTLVTDENQNSRKRIPMACDFPELKCRCISGPHFLLETGIVQEYKPEHINVHRFYGLGK
jgi:hypothetical protein